MVRIEVIYDPDEVDKAIEIAQRIHNRKMARNVKLRTSRLSDVLGVKNG